MSSNIVGIDIGNGNLKMALFNGRTYRLASSRLPENMIDDNRITAPASLAEFIKNMRKEFKMNAKACAIVLPENKTFFRHISMPAMTQDELLLNLPYEFRDYVTAEADLYFYDYAMIETQYDEEGKPQTMELFAAAVEKETIAEYANIFKKAGYKLELALPREMAYKNILNAYIALNPITASQEFCIVNVGHSKTCVDIYDGSRYIASKIIEIGCQDIDRAISDALNIDIFVASGYKSTNYEGVLDIPECAAVYGRFAIELTKVLNFYNFSNPNNNLHDLYFCGGGAEIPQLLQVIEAALGHTSHLIEEILPPESAGTKSLASCALAIAMIMKS